MAGAGGSLQAAIPLGPRSGPIVTATVDSGGDSAYTRPISDVGVALLCRNHTTCGHDPV
jgi:hypothetical protein